MQRIITFLLICTMAFATVDTFAQQSSCCSATGTFANFSKDIAFVNKHDEPVPFTFLSQKGNMQSFQCQDSTTASVYVVQATEPSNKYVLVFHEWWGLNDYIRQTADQLYTDLNSKVHVIALDLYDGKVATTRDSAQKYMQTLSQDRAFMIIRSLTEKFGDDVEIATIGWCMGGGYSLQASLLVQERAAACVIYYGFPETDKERLQTLEADVLMIWPNQDKWINAEVVQQFRDTMDGLNKKLRIEEYNADHAFANPSNPKHNPEMAADAYAKSLAFLKEGLDVD